MAINRLAISNASANTDTVLYTAVRNCLTSVIATNKSNSQSLIRIWIVPAGQSGDSTKWMHIAYDSVVTGSNSLETFRFPLENGDLVYVRADSANISFSLSGIYENSGAQKVYYDSTAPGAPSIGDIWVNSGSSYANTNTSAVIAYQAAEPTTKSPNLLWVDSSGNNTVFANQTGVAGNWNVSGEIQAYAVHSSANNDSLELYVGQTFNTYGDAAISMRGTNSGYNNGGMEFYAGGLEAARITSTQLLGVGTSTPTGRVTATGAHNDLITNWTKSAFVGNGSYGGAYALIDGSEGWSIRAQNAGTSIIFGQGSTSSSLTDVFSINKNTGLYYVGINTTDLNTGTGGRWASLGVRNNSSTTTAAIQTFHSNTSWADHSISAVVARSNNTAYAYYSAYSSTSSDIDWYVRGDGAVFSDSSSSMSTPADYAEYFEWADGNPNNEDRAGYSVSLVNGTQIKIAESGENVIGIVSANPAVVGDAAWNNWTGKYKKDSFNRYLRDSNGDRILSEDYNPEDEYIPREDRKEWSPVGMVGKLRMHKGQLVDPRWIKMRDFSDTVEEWLVR
jgi:hypothetical protein